MIALLLILIPLLSGIGAFFLKNGNNARSWALFSSLLTLTVSILGLTVLNQPGNLAFKVEWMPELGKIGRAHV